MPALSVLAIVFVAFAVSGCAEVPDYANPVEWYRSVVDGFDGEPRQVRVKAEPVPGASEPFPNLADVPEAPDRDVTLTELGQVAEGLAADREQARYTDEVFRGGDAVAGLAQPAAPAPQPAPQPLIAPQPTTQADTPSQPTVTAAAPPSAGTQVVAAPPAPSRDSIDVKSLFASLLESSGPRAVAPSAAAAGSLAAAPPAPDAETSTGERFVIQLAAFRRPAATDEAWRRLHDAHPDLLGRLGPAVRPTDPGGDKDVLYRLVAGPLPSEADARKLCARLRERDVDCFVPRQ